MVTKETLIQKLAETHDIPKAKAGRILNDILNTIVDEVSNGEDGKVCFKGFGTFTRVERKATTRNHPQTNEKLEIAAKTVPHFKAGDAFKRTVNK